MVTMCSVCYYQNLFVSVCKGTPIKRVYCKTYFSEEDTYDTLTPLCLYLLIKDSVGFPLEHLRTQLKHL